MTKMEDCNSLTKSMKRAKNVMRFTVHTELKKTPFDLHHGRKPKTELTNIIKDQKLFLQIGPKRPLST